MLQQHSKNIEITETESWFFEKIKETDKTIARLTIP
jgi:hypothetical protein